jgi:hypothetical protein
MVYLFKEVDLNKSREGQKEGAEEMEKECEEQVESGGWAERSGAMSIS